MRGVSSGQIVRDQPGVKEQVGIYLDETPISLSLFTPDIDLFDVSRVEVLRGPQGTLFGAGSEAGTVRYITNQPELGVTRWVGDVSVTGTSGGDPGGWAKVATNTPIGTTAASRFAAYYTRYGGFIDAVQPDLSVKQNVNGGDRAGARWSVKVQPDETFSFTPRVLYQEVKMDGWNRADAYNILANPFTTTRPAVTLGPYEQFTQIGVLQDSMTFEHRIAHAAGHLVWVQYRVTLIRDANDQPLHLLSQVQDISDRRGYEDRLRHLAEGAE